MKTKKTLTAILAFSLLAGNSRSVANSELGKQEPSTLMITKTLQDRDLILTMPFNDIYLLVDYKDGSRLFCSDKNANKEWDAITFTDGKNTYTTFKMDNNDFYFKPYRQACQENLDLLLSPKVHSINYLPHKLI